MRIVIFLKRFNVKIVYAILRYSIKSKGDVDSFLAEEHASPINVDSGTLGLGCNMSLNKRINSHSLNGEKLVGLKLPHWTALKANIKNTHKNHFNQKRLLGWDVAIIPDKSIIIELNGWLEHDDPEKIYDHSLSAFPEYELLAS